MASWANAGCKLTEGQLNLAHPDLHTLIYTPQCFAAVRSAREFMNLELDETDILGMEQVAFQPARKLLRQQRIVMMNPFSSSTYF